jgi:hypothetical protein
MLEAVKDARQLALLRKGRAFGERDQNYTNSKARTFSGQKQGISRAFWLKYDQNYELRIKKAYKQIIQNKLSTDVANWFV